MFGDPIQMLLESWWQMAGAVGNPGNCGLRLKA